MSSNIHFDDHKWEKHPNSDCTPHSPPQTGNTKVDLAWISKVLPCGIGKWSVDLYGMIVRHDCGHSSSLWFCPCFCPCLHFPHVLSQDFALALALYFAHLIEQNRGQGQGQNLGAKHEGNGDKGKNNWIWGQGQGQKKMPMWPVKIWDQGKMRWKYLKNRCYQFKGQSSTDQKSL